MIASSYQRPAVPVAVGATIVAAVLRPWGGVGGGGTVGRRAERREGLQAGGVPVAQLFFLCVEVVLAPGPQAAPLDQLERGPVDAVAGRGRRRRPGPGGEGRPA